VASGTTFLVDIKARLAGSGLDELGKLNQAAQQAVASYAEMERAAVRLQSGVDRLDSQAAGLRSAMESAMAAGDGGKFWKLAGDLEKVESSAGQARGKLEALRGAMGKQASAATAAANAVDEYRSAAQGASGAAQNSAESTAKAADGFSKLGGALGPVGTRVKDTIEGWRDLAGNIGKGRAAMLLGAAAVVALAAALVVGVVKLAAFAVGAADARRNLGLTLEAMGGSAEAGGALAASFDSVSRSTGVASDRLLDITRELKSAGVSAADMPDALRAIATQEAALGDTSGTSALIDSLKSGQKSAAGLASEMDQQFGSVVARRMKSLGAQSDTLQRNLAGLFGGLDIEPVLNGFARLVALFDSQSESGAALKALFESLFGPLVANVDTVAVKVEAFFLGAIAAALKVGIAVKSMAKQFGFSLGGLESLPSAAAIGETVMYSLAVVIGAVAAVVGLVAAAVMSLVAVWQMAYAAGKAAWDGITGAVDSALTKLRAVDLASIGTDMIAGLVKGISGAAGQVVDALSGVVDGAIEAAKSKLKIASPSRVFEELGAFTGEGFVVGVEDTAPMVQSAMGSLVEPPEAQAGKAARGAATVGPITINITGVAGVEDALDRIERAVDELFEVKALAMGAA
jgi:hypothetical protein